MKQARFYETLEDNRVRCTLCPFRCILAEGETGVCGVRKNINGTLMSLVWSKAVASGCDPIEKKPLFHVLPGSKAFSIATVGCNMRCAFCQNSDISQYPRDTGGIIGQDLPPEKVVSMAVAAGCSSIAYTYTEPTIFMEYLLDIAVLAKEAGLLNVMVSNGFISTDVITGSLKGLIDAINCDLKAFSDRFYRDLCHARLSPVLDAIRAYHASGIFTEITTLIIPGENDSDEELRQIAAFIHSIDPDIPWHISQYRPMYRYDKAGPTPTGSLEKARETGLDEGLHFVYIGNVTGHGGEDTYCPNCSRPIIKRQGFRVRDMHMRKNRCEYCDHIIPGRF
ncbi:MAG: AmmeMemoRadiSam system radical SAM enzyme [Thermodesulfobacteriota bacterium]|nr:AmmeMemoRadiSam system radical SAM enzyme [Thermodesulfobacteriota bacterium]